MGEKAAQGLEPQYCQHLLEQLAWYLKGSVIDQDLYVQRNWITLSAIQRSHIERFDLLAPFVSTV